MVGQMICPSVAFDIFPPFATVMECFDVMWPCPLYWAVFVIWCVAPVSAVTVFVGVQGWQVTWYAEGETQEKKL